MYSIWAPSSDCAASCKLTSSGAEEGKVPIIKSFRGRSDFSGRAKPCKRFANCAVLCVGSLRDSASMMLNCPASYLADKAERKANHLILSGNLKEKSLGFGPKLTPPKFDKQEN